jgi:hypothetical protein
VTSDAYYNDDVPMDHEKELLPVAVQVWYGTNVGWDIEWAEFSRLIYIMIG